MNDRAPVLLLAGFLFFLGLFSLVFLILFLAPADGGGSSVSAGSFVGSFLFSSFHYAAFFIPFYFWVCTSLLLFKPFRVDFLLLLNYLVFPFFTLGITLRLFLSPTVLDSPLTAFFARSFTRTGGAFLAALLFLLELVILPQLAAWFSRRLHSGEKMRFLLSEPQDRVVRVEPEPAEAEAEDEEEEPEEAPPERIYLPLLPEDSILAGRPAPAEEPIPEEPVPAEAAEVLPVEPVDLSPAETAEPPQTESLEVPDEALPLEEEEIPLAELEDEVPPELVQAMAEAAEPSADETEYVTADAADSIPAEIEEAFEEELDEIDTDEEVEETEDRSEETEDRSDNNEPEALVNVAPPAETVQRVAPRTRKKPYGIPVEGILATYSDGNYWEIDEETKRAGDVLRTTLEEFKIQAEVVGIRKGPVITMFEILPAPGVKLSKIVNLADNIALRLAASSVRIVAPIPGKQAVGIEIPNKKRSIVSFGELITDEKFEKAKMEIPVVLGKGIAGDAQYIDLVQTPHLLIAGATGSGKSVCVNSIICSILYRRTPEEVKLILIDPKIVELKFYNDIPHLLTPVITEPKKAFQALQYALYEMERRYSLLDALGVRDIRSYNRKIKQKNLATLPLPYLVIVVDEFADLMATTGKELESTLARLAAMSRAVGIHIVLATQRPSIDVITGLIKANIPSRIAFMVASKFDSRIIIDAVGAEKLLGRGDMLVASAWDPFPYRMQGAFLSEEEVERVVEYVKTLGEPDYIDEEIFIEDEEEDAFFEDTEEDPLMEKAIEIVTTAGKASASYLQRRLKIGYNRAARLVETMERRGIVGPQDGSKPRRILGMPEG